MCVRNHIIPRKIARSASKKLDIGDWWLIYMLSQNLDPIIFKDVLEEFLERLELRNNDKPNEDLRKDN